jgi:GNAT superfamily N-acetyltransferase
VPLDGLNLRDATGADLAAIGALRRSVGWDALDWALRAALESPSGRFVVVEAGEGDLVGSGSGMVYGDLGFVGNMVVAEPHRRRGIGSVILTEIVDHLRRAGCRRLELYATADGRRLYRRHGFELVGPSALAHVPRASAPVSGGVRIGSAEPADFDELAAYDAPRFGGDRRELLARWLSDDERPVRIARDAGAIVGYAWLRPDGERVGPLVAERPAVAGDLLADAFAAMPGAARLRLNLPEANRAGAAWLLRLGVALEPWDGRMALGPPIPRQDHAIYANVVGALG